MRHRLHFNAATRLLAFQPFTKLLIASAVDLFILTWLAAGCLWVSRQAGDTLTLRAAAIFSILAPSLTVLVLFTLGAYRTVVRFATADHLLRVIGAAAIGGLLAGLLGWQLAANRIHVEALLLYGAAGGTLLGLARGLAAQFLRPALRALPQVGRALIYGAGAAGTQLAAALQISGRFRLVGFVDQQRGFQGRTLLGLPVYAPESLPALKAAGSFDQILLAIPSVEGVRRRQLLESLAPLAAKVMVVPSLEDLASGKHRLDELRDVQVEELLSRDRVEPNRHLLELHIKGKTVMVTGAGGTIGSELCRQALAHGADKLVMLDHSEYGLYTVQQELKDRAFKEGCELICALGNVADGDLLVSVMHQNLVESVYHAAAYKHVSLVEQNVLAAVSNNILGTLAAARAAARCGVANFVLVSSDKAVRPSSIMGATKRVCELIVQALAAQHLDTSMSIVRFGNVLASSGSVTQVFQKQIRSGGPITVTHPEVTRYFMTITEAAELVIQAGAMGGKGDVFVLDMAKPIRILTLAERMIRLSGLEVRSAECPHGDIAIEIIGLRPGEKLHEELFIGEQPQPTIHPRISKVSEIPLAWPELKARIQALTAAISKGETDHVVWAVHHLAGENRSHGQAPVATTLPAHAGNLRIVRSQQGMRVGAQP